MCSTVRWHAYQQANELVQVECYLQSEGALVRFWYPVMYLERPPPGYRRSASFRAIDATNMTIHRYEMWVWSSHHALYTCQVPPILPFPQLRPQSHSPFALVVHLEILVSNNFKLFLIPDTHQVPSCPSHQVPTCSSHQVPTCPSHHVPTCPSHQVPTCPSHQVPTCPSHHVPTCPSHQVPTCPSHQVPTCRMHIPHKL